MSKGASGGIPEPLPGTPPPPINIRVNGGDIPAISPGLFTPMGATFTDNTDTAAFTFTVADKTISGTVTDGTTGLSNVDINIHSQGFGAGMNTRTASDGTFSDSDMVTIQVNTLSPITMALNAHQM